MLRRSASAPKLGDQIVLALYETHEAAAAAVSTLASAGIAPTSISIVGKNCEEQGSGHLIAAERARFFGKRGAFWGGLAGMLLGSGLFHNPVVGPLVVLGPLASAIVGGIEGAVLGGGASALFGALTTTGIPRIAVARYEMVIAAEQFLVTVHCVGDDVARIHRLLTQVGGSDVRSHELDGPDASCCEFANPHDVSRVRQGS